MLNLLIYVMVWLSWIGTPVISILSFFGIKFGSAETTFKAMIAAGFITVVLVFLLIYGAVV